MTAGTAILVFTREAGNEALCKGLSSRLSPKNAKEITSSLIANTIACVAESGLPYFVVPSAAQEGFTFAERFHNAYRTVFASGYDAVIAIGTDCPGLQTSDILSAAGALRSGHAVLGPASDGGTWLTALTLAQFQRLNFDSLPWSSEKLFDALETVLNQLGFERALLSKKGDVDGIDDLFAQAAMHRWLASLLALLTKTTTFPEALPWSLAMVSLPLHRGPPQIIS